MVLVIDVGNTTTHMGIFKDDALLYEFRFITKVRRTSDEMMVLFDFFFKKNNIDTNDIKGIIISTVVPDINYTLSSCVIKYLKREPILVEPGIKTGIKILTENPKEVGADRIVDALAAYTIYGGPCLVLNFGTATRYDLVRENGVFNAAVTSPGIQISADALWTNAAKLPNIEIKKPDSILAGNTITSMQAGLVYGYIGQVEYIVKKMKEEAKLPNAKVVATGGYAKIIVPETDVIDYYDPLLTLKGLKIMYDKNAR